MCLLGKRPQNNGTPMGTTKPQKNFRFQKCFYSPSNAEKIADFNGIIIFEIRQKLAEIS